MPDLKLTLSAEELGAQEGLLVEWVKELGDWVRKNHVIAVCQANGSQVFLKAPVQGVLQKTLVGANASFEAGSALAILRSVMGGT